LALVRNFDGDLLGGIICKHTATIKITVNLSALNSTYWQRMQWERKL